MVDIRKYKILVNFSGGVDSTAMVLQLLSEGKQIVIHHCMIKFGVHRYKHEFQAVGSIIKKLREDFPGQFVYIQTSIDISQFKRTYDSLHTFNMASAIAFSNPGIKEIYFGLNKNDNAASFDYQKIVSAVGSNMPTVQMPLINKTKSEIKEDIRKHQGYLELCFWCRKDRPENTPCGVCPACKQYQELV